MGSVHENPWIAVSMPEAFAGKPALGFPSKEYCSCLLNNVAERSSYDDYRFLVFLFYMAMTTVAIDILVEVVMANRFGK